MKGQSVLNKSQSVLNKIEPAQKANGIKSTKIIDEDKKKMGTKQTTLFGWGSKTQKL